MKEIIINKTINITDINNNNKFLLDTWYLGILKYKDINNWKEYKILYLYKDNELYLRPFTKYKCTYFEKIFGFDYDCNNYSSSKIIKIRYIYR